jgi:hypothetical protein
VGVGIVGGEDGERWLDQIISSKVLEFLRVAEDNTCPSVGAGCEGAGEGDDILDALRRQNFDVIGSWVGGDLVDNFVWEA